MFAHCSTRRLFAALACGMIMADRSTLWRWWWLEGWPGSGGGRADSSPVRYGISIS